MFRKLLVATDLSQASERVVCTIGGLKALGAEEALLLHCLNIRDVGTLGPQLMDLSRDSIEKQAKLLEKQGLRVETKMCLGLPHIEVLRQAVDAQCSLIVLGSQGRSLWAELFLGGTANAVLQSSTLPVLLLHLKVALAEGRTVCEEIECNPLRHVLYPTDFSDTAERAFGYVEEIVKRGGRRVSLCHVQDKGRLLRESQSALEEYNRIDRERLKRLEQRLRDLGATEVAIELLSGAPKQEIVQLARRGDYSILVMGTQGRGFFGGILMGSVAFHVARNVTLPILFVPPSQA